MFNKLIRFILTAAIVTTTVSSSWPLFAYQQQQASKTITMSTALDYYGFEQPEQRQALLYLMQKAGIADAAELLNNKSTDPNELTRNILRFVKESQQNFTIRSGAQERWEVDTSAWMKDPAQHATVMAALKTLDLVDRVRPTFKTRDGICVLGATKNTMIERLNYAATLYNKQELPAAWLILLAGERYATADKNGLSLDGTEESLQDLATQLGKTRAAVTETDLMRVAYTSSKLYGKFPDHFVLLDTPRRDLPRPTTETTVTELCAWLRQHPEIETVTFISNQPHVDYQQAIIAQVMLKQGIKVKFEVIGPQYINTVVSSDADQLNYLVQALGSRIWASTPEVLDKLGLDITEPQLRAEYMRMYEKQPLIYNNLKAKFTPAP